MMKKIITSQIHSENKAGNEIYWAWIQAKSEFIERPRPSTEVPENEVHEISNDDGA